MAHMSHDTIHTKCDGVTPLTHFYSFVCWEHKLIRISPTPILHSACRSRFGSPEQTLLHRLFVFLLLFRRHLVAVTVEADLAPTEGRRVLIQTGLERSESGSESGSE